MIDDADGGGSDADGVEYCQFESFNATCPGSSQLVVVDEARYGRQRLGRCASRDHSQANSASYPRRDGTRVPAGVRRSCADEKLRQTLSFHWWIRVCVCVSVCVRAAGATRDPSLTHAD